MGARPSQAGVNDHAANLGESRLRLLVETGLLLARERNLDIIVQSSLDAGLLLSGASFGAFFYSSVGREGEPYQLYKVAGLDPAAFAAFPMPRPTAVFAPTFSGNEIIRSADITADPRYGGNAPLRGMPPGHPPVRSYLAVPVRDRDGEVLGGLLYGHPEPGVFAADVEGLVATVASQAAVAIHTFRLTNTLTREIAERDAARAEQRTADQRLRHALDAAQLGTWDWSADTELIDLDERGAMLFGVPAHQPLSRDALRAAVVHPDDLHRSPDDLRKVLVEGGSYCAEYRIRLPDGTQRWISASGTRNRDEETGRLLGLIGTVQDISARKQQEESLRQSEKLAATGRLAATIAHEINNPLEAVTNLIYLSKTDPELPPHIESMLESADTELARVAHIAQQTLGFYRDTSRPATIDLNQLLQAVVDLFSRKLAGKRLHCELDLSPGLSVVGLQGEIRQVVSNLLVNAIEASPATGASIRIRGRHRRRDGRHGVSVLISDEGEGIPDHVRGRLFTPFMTTKQSRGTGLGLWVTRGMVEKHGGTVRFRSRTVVPAGTVFRVYLPQVGAGELFTSPLSGVIQ